MKQKNEELLTSVFHTANATTDSGGLKTTSITQGTIKCLYSACPKEGEGGNG